MIYLICRALFMLVVLEEIHAKGRHHHKLANYHHDHSNHHNLNTNVEHDYDNDNFANNVKSDNERVDEMNDDDDYYDYMNDLSNQQEEIAVGELFSRSTSPVTDFYDYGDNDKDTSYEPPDDYQGDEGDKQHMTEVDLNRFRHSSFRADDQQEAQRYTRRVQTIRRNAIPRSNPAYEDYQSDAGYRDPNQVNNDKRSLGTVDGVEKARSERIKYRMDLQAITSYMLRIENEWRCSKPHAKLIPVVSDKPSSRFRPYCVELHVCGSDTGCCNNSNSCLPLKTELVNIPLAEEIVMAGAGDKPKKVIQMQFVNHTECGCQSPKDVCKCPKNFVPLLRSRNICTCECLSQNTRCLNQTLGIMPFTETDKECIREGLCKVPKCSFGSYRKSNGECPQRLHF